MVSTLCTKFATERVIYSGPLDGRMTGHIRQRMSLAIQPARTINHAASMLVTSLEPVCMCTQHFGTIIQWNETRARVSNLLISARKLLQHFQRIRTGYALNTDHPHATPLVIRRPCDHLHYIGGRSFHFTHGEGLVYVSGPEWLAMHNAAHARFVGQPNRPLLDCAVR